MLEKQKKVGRIKRITFFLLGAVIIVLMALFPFCKKAVLTAPDNSTLVVTVNPAVIPLGGQAVVKVVGFKASGTPVPDGTVIFFSVNIGTIEARKETRSGEAEALFQSNDHRSGVATVTVTSGTAEVTPESITITVGAAGLASLGITSDPPVLPVGGGVATLRVTAFDENQNPLANIPVTLSTNAGQLNSGGNTLTTAANGIAQDLLQTGVTSLVTATSGNVTADITVHVETNEDPTASFVFSPTSPKVDEKVNFNASASSDTDGTIVSFQWAFGDGGSGSGVTVAHKYKNAGTFAVVLVVEDNSGNSGTASQTVTVNEGNAPVASFVYSPASPAENETIYFNASGSTDEDGTIVSFQWNFGDGTTADGETVTHQYGSSGSYTVILEVTDDDGNTGNTSQTVTIGANENPVASFIFSPTSPAVDQDVHFDASDSNDPDGTIVAYEWDFGDGTTGTGLTVIHRYSTQGSYTVYLRVTDNSGNTANTTKPLTVSDNQSPTASFVHSPQNPVINEAVHFNASGSTDPDGNIETYYWDFGDGESFSGTTNQVDHTFSDATTYVVVLVVTDNSGNSGSVSEPITILDGTPIASFTISPSNPEVDDTITFNASGSSDPNGRIESWTWDFGDGSSPGSTEIITHKYTAVGIYVVKLTVTDDDGNTAEASQTVTVN
jgi:PKD repeat protein